MKKFFYRRWAVGVFLLAALDFWTKNWAERNWKTPLPLINDILTFRYVENYGIAFSIPFSGPVLLISNVLIFIALLVFGWKMPCGNQRLWGWALILLTGGALGNMIDRFTRGYVIDFIALGNFPVFNVADSALTIGALLLLFHTLKQK